jgi:adenylylsulfate kinase-like enzyme
MRWCRFLDVCDRDDWVSTKVPVLWLCGPPGVGKTAVAWEVYTRLVRARRAPAYVDVDQVGICYPPPAGDPARHRLKARNLGALRANVGAAGAECLVVSGVVDPRRGPEIDLVGGEAVAVCRLRADPAELATRLAGRRGSTAQPDAALRDGELLDRSTFTDWWVDTTALSVDEVANRVCAQIGDWPCVTSGTGARRSSLPPGAAGGTGPSDVLWLCGPTGVGKSTVGFRAYLAVLRSGFPAAYVDVDQLGFCATRPTDHVLRARNLAALWSNVGSVGSRALVVVGPIASRSEAMVYEQALPTTTFTWCRLHANHAELVRRILSRCEGGSWPQPGDPLSGHPIKDLLEVADRAVADAHVLERQGPGQRIDVTGLAVDEAADTILRRTGWPTTRAHHR